MIDRPGDHPFPHTDLASRNPLLFTLRPGDVLYRHHQKIHQAVHFGTTGEFRFDDPKCPAPGSFGVLYAGDDPECCLLESCGATAGARAVTTAFLAARSITRLELTRNLRFIDLVAPGGLASIGADSRLTTGSYKVAQQWSAALRKHPAKPDGIRYRSRHAPERIAYAIYSRPASAFATSSLGSFTSPQNEALFKDFLNTYKFALI